MADFTTPGEKRMSRKKQHVVFDSHAVAIALEEEAIGVLIDNMRTAQDECAQNDAAYKLWVIANSTRGTLQ